MPSADKPIAVRSSARVSRSEAEGDAGAVVCVHPEAVAAGERMLARGGSAVDAAVAAAFAEAVALPSDASLGGCGFMLVHDTRSGRSTSVEFPARAPAAARAAMFAPSDAAAGRLIGVHAVAGDANRVGALAATVPTLVAGLCAAHERFGRLTLAELLEPAITIAHDGFVADPYFVLLAGAERATLAAHGLGDVLLVDDGPPRIPVVVEPEPGSEARVRQPALARTLELLALEGPDAFYRGPTARALARELQAVGGVIDEADFAACVAEVGEPLALPYRGGEVLGPSGPGGAWTALQALGILEQLVDPGCDGEQLDALHAMAEALRHAFADRYHHLADPTHVPVPLEGLLSPGYLAEIAERIDRRRATLQLPAGVDPWVHFAAHAAHDPWPWDPRKDRAAPVPGSPDAHASAGTTHVCAADAQGLVVTCTHTAVTAFGSQLGSSTGVTPNSAMVWFDPRPGHANSIAPGKRPLSNMAPLLVRRADGSVAGIGAPGGRRIVSAVVQVADNLLGPAAGIQDALSAPRLDASGNPLLVADGVPDEILAALRARGHTVRAVARAHEPFSYELARPSGVRVDAAGRQSAGLDAYAPGSAVALRRTAP